MTLDEQYTSIEEKIPKVFDAGKKAEYDAFWDEYQNNGNRTNYGSAFAGIGWTTDTFKPKYDIRPIDVYMMFRKSHLPIDLVAYLDGLGITLDFSNASASFQYTFDDSQFTRIGRIDFSKARGAIYYIFSNTPNLRTIDEFVVSEKITNYSNVFTNSTALENITITGVIGASISFQWSPLSVASMKSIISCLKNYAGTSNDLSYSITFNDECWAALEADSTSPNGNTWKEHVNSLGWNT